MNTYNDYIGKKIDLVRVLKRVSKDKFMIECDCGTIKEKYMNNLLKSKKLGNVVSCGCMKSSNMSKKAKGKPSKRKINFTKGQVDKMVSLYDQKMNLREIGKLFGVSLPVIRTQLLLRGCEVKQRRYEIVEGYFKTVDSEEKAYWLGFLAADGCIRRRENSKGKTQGDAIYLKLSVLDEGHLERFRDSICPNGKIYYHINKITTKKGTLSISHTCALGLYSNELVKDITELGVGPRKTFNVGKPNIDPKFYRDYIRGFFDGDGCCYIKEFDGAGDNKRLTIQYSFACASKDLRDFFVEELEKEGITTKCNDNLNLNVTGGFINSKKFFDYLYTDATIYLERKYDKGMVFVNYFNSLPKNIFVNEYVYNPSLKGPNRVWTEEELKVLIDTNDIIPYSYLSGTLLPNKSKNQIARMRKKLGLKARRKIPGYLNIRNTIKGDLETNPKSGGSNQ